MSEHLVERNDLSLGQLAELRKKTDAISRFLSSTLSSYLKTLQPLLIPERMYGRYAGAKDDIAGAEKAFVRLQEKYKEVCGKPFNLPTEFDKEFLAAVDSQLQLAPWDYLYEIKTAQETKAITITSPLRWILTYRSPYSPSQLRQMITGKEERRFSEVRQFVASALVLYFVLERLPGVLQIFTDLRFRVHTEQPPGFGTLPLTIVDASLSSFRPSDDLLNAATQFSGVPAFIELIDLETVAALQDPLKLQIESLIR